MIGPFVLENVFCLKRNMTHIAVGNNVRFGQAPRLGWEILISETDDSLIPSRDLASI